MPKNPSHRKSLNPKQIFLLHIVFKFRFVSARSIATCLGVSSHKLIYFRLQNLYEQGLLHRSYDTKHKLAGLPAIYDLAPVGIRYLKAHSKLNHKALHNMYFNSRSTPAFVEHCIRLQSIFAVFKHWYGPKLEFFTKSELYDFDYFPKQLPDAYVVIPRPNKPPKDYLLDLFDSSIPPFTITNKIKAYRKHHQAEVWEGDFPNLLFICESPRLERQVQRTAQRVFANIEDVNIYTTSLKALIEATSKSNAIWTDAKEPEKLLSF